MKFRQHRGSAADAMETMIELPDREALVTHVKGIFSHLMTGTALDTCFEELVVAPYFSEYDHRFDWAKTYLVIAPGFGPVGFIDSEAPRS